MQLHERSFGDFRLSPKPPTRWDEGSSSRCWRRKRQAQSCQPISPAVQQYSLTPTASRNSTKNYKIDSTDDKKKDRKNPVEKKSSRKGPFSTCGIRLCKKWPYTVEKGLFRLNFFRLSFLTGGFSRTTFSTGSVSRKTPTKKFYTCFWKPSHRSSHHKTHTHMTTQPYQVPHCSSIQQRRRWLGYHCCCFSPQVSVAHS